MLEKKNPKLAMHGQTGRNTCRIGNELLSRFEIVTSVVPDNFSKARISTRPLVSNIQCDIQMQTKNTRVSNLLVRQVCLQM